MLNGLICLTFNIPNISEIIGEEDNGIYLNNNIVSMKNKLLNINNYELKKIALNASNLVKNKFHINQILKSEIIILKDHNHEKNFR